ADTRSDVYAFGAMAYELLCGRPVFDFQTATDGAIQHLVREPEPPSAKAPRGWITRDVDQLILSLLQKDASLRPKDAAAVLEILGDVGRPSAQMRAARSIAPEKVDEMVEALLGAPADAEAALALEN